MRVANVARMVGTVILGTVLTLGFSLPSTAQVGCTPPGTGTDDAPPTPLNGVINSYYPPNPGTTASPNAPFTTQAETMGTGTAFVLPAGSTSCPYGIARSGTDIDGEDLTPTDIAIGNLLLFIQMQDADYNTSDTSAYGSGGASGNGFTAINRTGLYEYVRVTAVTGTAATGGTVTFISAGGGGLVNSYRVNDANMTNGNPARRFQIVKVPQYTQVGFGTALTGASWDGSTGGVLAADIQNVLQLTPNGINALADMSFKGFRGGAGINLTGAAAGSSTTFRSATPTTLNSQAGAHGQKGEGICGTPNSVYSELNTARVTVPATQRGYPDGAGGNGSNAQGAPGSAGGGATDSNPTPLATGNFGNSGGGGGSNCGSGGVGGNTRTNPSDFPSSNATGGRGGVALFATASSTRIFMGGGGGAGSRNVTGSGNSCSGGVGGGIIIIRAGSVLGSGEIRSNGSGGVNSGTDDGGGGGAAGGTIIFLARTAPTGGLVTCRTNGGVGGNNSPSSGGGGSIGPGGGGGGGAIFTNFTLNAASQANGGSNGTTDPGSTAYGSTAGGTTGGCIVTTTPPTDPPGVPPGYDCIVPSEARNVTFDAVQYANGEVGLKWTTGYEVNNLGFRVWRETRAGRQLVNTGIIAGNALTAGTTLTAGNAYAWKDSVARAERGIVKTVKTKGGRVAESSFSESTVSYWLEDIDMNGKSSWNGPFELKTSKQPMPESLRNAPMLGRNNPVFGSQTVKALASADPMELNRYLANSAAVQTNAKSAQTNSFQQTLAAGPAVKLGVRTTGWQSVSRSALISAGLNPSAVDANLRMYVNGTEVPIRVSANSVEFYGVAADTLQSGEQTYWLVEGTSAGLRIPTLPITGGSKVGVANFVSLVERRDRTTYFAALQNGDADNFFGAVVSNSAVDQAVTLRNRDANAAYPAQVAVTLQGVSLNAHRVSVKLNGQTIGEVNYANRDQQTFTTTVAQSQLLEGQNTVTLQSADSSDVNLVAAVRISHARSLIADADALSLSGRAGQTLTVRGFTQAPRVFDVTDPANPIEVFVRADGAGAGNISASFVAPGAAGSNRLLVATTASRFLTPTVTSNTPSTLSASTNAADFVILTTPELAPALTPLVQLRQSQGLVVKVVDVADVYDEFSFGVKSAQAIKDFLNLASHNWQTPVRYAMFAGDASFDPRDFLGFNQDVVPTKLLGLGSLETASDDWFGDFDDSGFSQIAIGRLPARTQADITAMVSKIVAYDQARGQAWQREALIVADNNDFGGNFETEASQVGDQLPASFVKTSVQIGQIGASAARTQILSTLNDGKGFVNYSGHGSVANWAGESVLTSDDVANLTNATRPGIVVSMTCLNGFFHDPYSSALGKVLIRTPNRGASLVWASSSLTVSPGQREMNLAVVRRLYGTNPAATVGDAIRQAKAITNDPIVRQTWVLFGDPTTRQ